MSAKFIPPKGERGVRVEQIREKIEGALSQFIVGRGKEKKLAKATDELMGVLEPHFKLPSKPTMGATVMTESATRDPERGIFRKGPNQL